MADQNTNCDFNALCRSVITARKELAKLRKDIKSVRDMFVKRFKEIEKMLKDVGEGKLCQRKTELEKEKFARLARVTDSSHVGTCSKRESRKPACSNDGVNLTNEMYNFYVIGYIKTCFKEKNGIPRQGSLCPLSKAVLCIDSVEEFTNPSHALEGLEKFSHVWLLFVFHKNSNNSIKAKVCPPRLDGKKVGVFASRSPHRPSPIGLTLVQLDGIQGNKLFLSGVDILDGTPILDVKPYIPDYDSVHDACIDDGRESIQHVYTGEHLEGEMPTCLPGEHKVTELDATSPDEELIPGCPLSFAHQHHGMATKGGSLKGAFIPDWIKKPPISPLSVSYSDRAEEVLRKFYNKFDNKDNFPNDEKHKCYQFELIANSKDVKAVIERILQEDPRSVYRRNNCADEIYHFTVDKVNVSCLFRGNKVQVIDINPIQNKI